MDLPQIPLTELCRFSSHFENLPHKFGGWNSGMVLDRGDFLFSCRNETSRYNNKYFDRSTPNEVRWERYVPALIHLDKYGNFIQVKKPIIVPDESLEDVRLFKLNGEIFLTGTKRLEKGVTQFLGKLLDNIVYFLPFNHKYKPNQKNWNPIVFNNTLYFEQSMSNPRTILKYDKGNLIKISETNSKFDLRGNCSPIDIGDKLLTFYHYYVGPKGYFDRVYVQYAAYLDKEPPFNIQKIFGPFKFNHGSENRIQFHTGLEILNDEIYFSYGVEDSDNIFAKIDKNLLIKFIENTI